MKVTIKMMVAVPPKGRHMNKLGERKVREAKSVCMRVAFLPSLFLWSACVLHEEKGQ